MKPSWAFRKTPFVRFGNGWKLVDQGRGGAGVGRALERVQGPKRAWLEGLRNEPQPSELADRTSCWK